MARSMVATGAGVSDARSQCVAIALDIIQALNLDMGELWIVLAQPDNGSDPEAKRMPFDIANAHGLIHRDFPGTVFVNWASAWSAPHGVAGVIAHELCHVGQVFGRIPTSGDHEFRARQFGQDFGEAYAENPNAHQPFAGLFDDEHPRHQFYRDVRAGERSVRVSDGWDRADFWGATAEPARRSASTPKPTNHAAELLAEARRLPKGATAYGLLRGFRAW